MLTSFGLLLALMGKSRQIYYLGEKRVARPAAIQITTANSQSTGLCEFIPTEILHQIEFVIHSTVCHRQEAITTFYDVSYILEQNMT